MKNLIFTFIGLIIASISWADEGMWMLNHLKESNWQRMKELGFTLTEDELYSTENSSLKDAVVIFGGGCTGITVSDKGLIFTNHHCGFDAIQSQSSVEHDYLKDGFIAQTQEQELRIPDLEIRYLLYTENITEKLFAASDTIQDEYERLMKIQALAIQMEDSVKNNNEFIDAVISSYFNKNEYYLNVYQVFKDIRMVFAPPSSVGKFGADTDNWMWPRHTGDFSVFRVYAGADNQPAKYSPENIPYNPKKFAQISLAGYKASDYSMTIGFPGSTSRYLSSWGIMQEMNDSNKPRIETRGIKQDIWKEAMVESDEIRIKYASKYASSSNYWKNSIGMNRGIEQMRVIDRKKVIEKQFTDWLEKNPDKKEIYGNALELIEKGYTSTNELRYASTYLQEAFMRGTEIVEIANIAMELDVNLPVEEQESYWKENLEPIYKNYLPELDRKVLVAMLKLAKKRLPEIYLLPIYKEIDKKYKGDYEKYADNFFKKSVIPYPEKLKEILKDKNKVKKLSKDPAYQLAMAVREIENAIYAELGIYFYDTLKGERLFFAGLKEMNPDRNFYSDANFTMRLSYGNINGYIPYDGAWYDYSTTQKGVLEKYKKGDYEFDVQDEILKLLSDKNFGNYANENGDINLCFISNNDITGGNSGSPMFNKNGNLMGLAFDGNWEAMSGDIVFEPEVQKTIGVDIRYVLFMIDKWGKCDRLMKEIKLAD